MTDPPVPGPVTGESPDLGGYLQQGLQILQLEPEANPERLS